jgi:hypothetical protein
MSATPQNRWTDNSNQEEIMAKKYCCKRFADCINEGEIVHAGGNDETAWYVPNWHHLYYCPFCGAFIKGEGFGK